MKITRETQDQLILSDVPWLIGLMLIVFIVIFVGAGLFMVEGGNWVGLPLALVGGALGFGAFAGFVRRVQVIFDRPAGRITIRARSVFGYAEVIHDLSHLSEAALESSASSKGNTLYRPVLVLNGGMSAGRHPMVQTFTNTRGPVRAVEAVNRWLESGRHPNAQLDSGDQTP